MYDHDLEQSAGVSDALSILSIPIVIGVTIIACMILGALGL